MSATLVLFIAAFALALVATIIHFVMVVHGFKTSTGWGLACLLVPAVSLVFAFAKYSGKGKPVLAGLLLVGAIGSGVLGSIASYQTAQAAVGSAEAVAEGLEEFEKATQELDGLEDLQLDDLQLDAPKGEKKTDAGSK